MVKHRKIQALRRANRSRSDMKRAKRKFRRRTLKSGLLAKRRRAISKTRLERGLRVLSDSNDLKTAARAIRVTPEKFKRAARRKRVIHKIGRRWRIARRLSRRMPVFTNGKQLAITVRAKSASLTGRYMSAVGKFLRTNDPSVLAEFAERSVKDVSGKIHPFETNPNTLYRLSSAGSEPFEAIYKIVL